MNNIQLTVDALEAMQPLEIVESPAVRDKFIQIYDTLWGAGTGQAAYERESHYFNTILRDKDGGKLLKAKKFSIFTAFIDLAVCGISLEPGPRALCYLMGRNVNVGTREKPEWEGRLVLTISGYGELVSRARCGQIQYADNPVVVYDNDEFSFSERNGQKSIDYTAHFPHTGRKIVAVFMKIVRNGGSTDYSVMYEEDWQRLEGYSLKNNQRTGRDGQTYGKANDLYSANGGQIDPGFLIAKCIKHAFKTYPKVRIGRGTELQTQQIDKQEMEINDDLYGIAPAGSEYAPGAALSAEQSGDAQPAAFAPGPVNDGTAGITVSPDESEGF